MAKCKVCYVTTFKIYVTFRFIAITLHPSGGDLSLDSPYTAQSVQGHLIVLWSGRPLNAVPLPEGADWAAAAVWL